MKRKNIAKLDSENNKESINLRNKQQNQKRFIDTALCQSDSDESLLETNTNYSVMHRNKNQNNLADFSVISSNKNIEKDNSDESPKKRRNSVSSNDKIDVRKKLCDFKIIENENEIGDVKNNRKPKSKDPFTYLEFEQYPCDHSAMKQLDFELKICLAQRTPEKLKRNTNDENTTNNIFKNNKEILNDFSKEISAWKNNLLNYFNKNILFYYELKNSNGNESKLNHLEANNSYINNNDKIGSKIATIKEDAYIESLNYIFSKLLESNNQNILERKFNNFSNRRQNENENNFFYILLPLYACYFFNNLESKSWDTRKENLNENGILISNVSRNLEKKINDKGIAYEKIDASLTDISNNNHGYFSRRKYSESKSVRSTTNNTNSSFNYINDYSHFIQGDYNEIGSDSSIIYIKNYNQVLFFNEFINSYEESYFRIISPFPFANSRCLTNQFFIDVFRNEDCFVFKGKIIGCIFQNQLKKLLEFFQEISECFSFSINHYHKTPAFHLINEKLKQPMENVKYQNKKFYVRAKK